MTYCKKCGAMLQPVMKFCTKCGQPIDLQPQAPTQPQGVSKPQRPQPLKAMAPQQPMKPQPMRPQAPGMPPKPMQPQRPVMPQAPQTPQASKGMFTNAVRSVANAMTGGALNRQIAEEQRRAVNQQATESQSEIRDARNAQQQAEQAQIAAEREAERSRDRRSMEAVDGVDVVRGRTIWNIQPGEIARKISERELDEIEKLKGIIVQEGCTAIIFANGELVSTLSAGAYLFYKSVEEEQAAIKNAVEKAEKDMAEAEKRERDRRSHHLRRKER
ncbi:MAG: zinc-ribbon domain-containing protein [Prevotella sp.]|nr:zinc-ribbon domain-containing protein [Prevotella sp.]